MKRNTGFGEKTQNFIGKKKLPLLTGLNPTKKVLSKDKEGKYVWFKGGWLNTCFNCLDRHVNNGLGNKNAIIYDSPISNRKSLLHITNCLTRYQN